ncbi:CAP domain-containing protein [Jeotgalibacillus sp. S-D1]|uniref:CAP domain-containing protein n=1 Tax=Jeotgalibacillus sp. S-D1 TaxID=2552189 RepID=UPI0014046C3A|nr:CAP domain-containing protein [Jeotgalibacillus sp. S-D1]
MKVFLRIMVVLVTIFLIGFYSGPSIQENEILDNEFSDLSRQDSKSNTPPEISDGLTRPKSGLSIYIGKSAESFTGDWGEPDRIDPGQFKLDWMIYNRGPEGYMQVALKNGVVRGIFAFGEGLDVSPYYIGQPIDEIYRFSMINSEIVVENNDNVYQFELSEQDLQTRLLIPFGDIFAQILVDEFTGKVLGIYYLDKETLIEQRPYELVYRGELPPLDLKEDYQREIDAANEQQIFDMTNVLRTQRGLNEMNWEEDVAKVARGHSENMYEDSFFANESPTEGTLADRLTEMGISFQEASENIASNYHHSFAVMHAWMNSSVHRETLLKEEFTHLGVGVYQLYFTQDFIKNTKSESSVNENASAQ